MLEVFLDLAVAPHADPVGVEFLDSSHTLGAGVCPAKYVGLAVVRDEGELGQRVEQVVTRGEKLWQND